MELLRTIPEAKFITAVTFLTDLKMRKTICRICRFDPRSRYF